MTNHTFDDLFDAPFTFHLRPRPLACELRPVWRLHTLVLILGQCWGGQASLEQLHVLNWAARTRESRLAFLDFLASRRSPSDVIVRYDPSLNRAVHFAFAEELIIRREVQPTLDGENAAASPPYRIHLSPKGRELLKSIHAMDDCFEDLKQFLAAIPEKVTQKQVDMLFSWETNP